MSRFLLPIALLGVSALALLSPTPAFAEGFDGPYVGAQAGVAVLHVEGSILSGPVDRTDETAFGAAVLGYRTSAWRRGARGRGRYRASCRWRRCALRRLRQSPACRSGRAASPTDGSAMPGTRACQPMSAKGTDLRRRVRDQAGRAR